MTTRDQALNRIRPDVRAMHAYAVQSAQGLLKLDAIQFLQRSSFLRSFAFSSGIVSNEITRSR